MIPLDQMLGRKPFACPNCGKELPVADVNIAQDVALCRACGYQGPFLAAAAVPRLSDEELARPPKRVSLQKGFNNELVIICRSSRMALWFLIPFTTLWSGGSMAGIYIVPLAKGNFNWHEGLFGLPFLLGTLVLLAIILYTLLGKTTVTLSKGRVEVFTGLFGAGRRQVLDCGAGTTVMIQQSNFRSNNVPQPEIVVTSGDGKLKFGAMTIPNEAQPYVAAVLSRAAAGG